MGQASYSVVSNGKLSYNQMMKHFGVPFSHAFLVPAALMLVAHTGNAEDPSIERLLNKLPAPEKLVKPSVERSLNQEDPASRDPMATQIIVAARSGNMARAMDLSRKLCARYPKSAAAECLRGMLAVVLRQYGEAAVAFRRATALQPTFSLGHFGLALVEASQNRYGAAIPHLKQLTRLEPKSAVGWMALSDCALRVGRKEESAEHARKATMLAPSMLAGWVQLARAEAALGRTEAALTALSRGAEISPDNATMLATVGFGYINLNRIPQAIPPLQRAARLAPKDFLVHAQLGYCLQATGQLDAGIRHLRLGASLAPKNYGPVWDHLGVAYQKKGLHRDAVKAFERATQIMPGYRLAWQHLAAEYRILGQVAEANRAEARARATPARPLSAKQKKL